jgi:Protein of unknown function (DUF1573)
MKKIVLFAMVLAFGLTANAQTKTKAKKTKTTKTVSTTKVTAPVVVATTKSDVKSSEGAGMVFDQETIDYGTITKNAEGKREFVFTNNGTKPLIITTAQGSCGCTVPTTPKDPIAPGAKGVIGVKYDTNRVGAFTKTVTISSNAEGMPSKVVTIKGTVIDDAATPAAAKQ